MSPHPQHHEHPKKRHANGHGSSGRAGSRVKRTAEQVSHRLKRLEARAGAALDETEQQTLSAARVLSQWVSDNPKLAIGALIGTGIVVGLIGATRLGRATLLGLGGLAVAFAQRIARSDEAPHAASV
jgi:ElaB/YqjD/DUF883 family membrane-anchored ribosome-binding protein